MGWLNRFEKTLDNAEKKLKDLGPIYHYDSRVRDRIGNSIKVSGIDGFICEFKYLIRECNTPSRSDSRKIKVGIYHFRSMGDMYRCYLYYDDSMKFSEFVVSIMDNMFGAYCSNVRKIVYDEVTPRYDSLLSEYELESYSNETIGINRIQYRNLLRYYLTKNKN